MIRGMVKESLVERARELWRELARGPVGFGADGSVSLVVSPESALCPRGWTGIVRIGDAAIASVPDDAQAAAARAAFARLPLADLVDPARLAEVLPLAEALGPAALAYLSAEEFRPAKASEANAIGDVEPLPADHADVVGLGFAAGEQDANEASLDGITSPAFVVRAPDGSALAAAGYRLWPGRTAHISVLTHPAWRSRGLAKITGSAAARHALEAGLLPQWRARVPASRRAAVSLGFRELGAQLSIRVQDPVQHLGSAVGNED